MHAPKPEMEIPHIYVSVGKEKREKKKRKSFACKNISSVDAFAVNHENKKC
jgi:hypothetical protein